VPEVQEESILASEDVSSWPNDCNTLNSVSGGDLLYFKHCVELCTEGGLREGGWGYHAENLIT